jgi:hypothetical protein
LPPPKLAQKWRDGDRDVMVLTAVGVEDLLARGNAEKSQGRALVAIG